MRLPRPPRHGSPPTPTARLTPDADGTVIPNLPDRVIEAVEAKGFEYWQGQFWFGNRYAVVFRHRSAITD